MNEHRRRAILECHKAQHFSAKLAQMTTLVDMAWNFGFANVVVQPTMNPEFGNRVEIRLYSRAQKVTQ
jgi:hypothetical protein